MDDTASVDVSDIQVTQISHVLGCQDLGIVIYLIHMQSKYLQIAILVVLAVAVVYLIPHKATAPITPIADFNGCVSAGGTVAKGVCTAPGGTCCYVQSPQANPDVIVDTPQPNALVTSPLTVKGRAKNNWYFEASLPGKLVDANNTVLVQKPFMAATDWMTPGYVDFSETLTFPMPATQYGMLILNKDNPSGEPQNDASFAVPVRFW